MNRLGLGIMAAVIIGVGALSVYAGCREAEVEDLRQKLLVQERRAEEEKTLPDAPPPRRNSDGEERPQRSYEMRPDEGATDEERGGYDGQQGR